jgi:hypothetical protein
MAASTTTSSPNYFRNVFINCPFDPEYQTLYHAFVFVITYCGFIPRCALEAVDSGDVRILKIVEIIAECCYGVHDISRTEHSVFTRPDGTMEALPRFNMPLELGLFIGAQRLGGGRQQKKNYLIFDVEKGRYQRYISDLAGQDIQAHDWPGSGSPLVERDKAAEQLIIAVRNWLNKIAGGGLVGGMRMSRHFREFQQILPLLATELAESEADLSFYDLTALVGEWLRENP